MQLIIDIPDEFDERILEAFGGPDINRPIHDAPYIKTTKEGIEDRLKNYIRQIMYAYEDNRDLVQTMRERGAQQW
jgi:hypothetical protein